MVSVTNPRTGVTKMQAAMKDYQQGAAVQQARATWRAARAGRTFAAKALRRHTGYPSRHLKSRLKRFRTGFAGKGETGIWASRRPLAVEFLQAKEDRDTDIVTVGNWPTAGGSGREVFQPARERDGRFYGLIRGRWRRLKGQSPARVWVGLHEQVQARMREVYSRHMATWITGVRRRAGAKS